MNTLEFDHDEDRDTPSTGIGPRQIFFSEDTDLLEERSLKDDEHLLQLSSSVQKHSKYSEKLYSHRIPEVNEECYSESNEEYFKSHEPRNKAGRLTLDEDGQIISVAATSNLVLSSDQMNSENLVNDITGLSSSRINQVVGSFEIQSIEYRDQEEASNKDLKTAYAVGMDGYCDAIELGTDAAESEIN